jgi:UDP-N-acetylmuramate--alanine ligase
MVESFKLFARSVKNIDERGRNGGILFICREDVYCEQIADELDKEGKFLVWTYGISTLGSWVENVHFTPDGYTVFDYVERAVSYTSMEHRVVLRKSTIRLPLPGKHNILNALAARLASSVITDWQSEPQGIKALESFKPTARRFDLRADINRIAIIDDYAHNPMSIRAVLEAVRQRYPDRAVWVVWQPHTYSRTQALFNDFVTSFGWADHVLITDIYAAREPPLPGVTSAAVVAAMSHTDVRHTPSLDDAVAVLSAEVQAPAAVLIMSAGDAPAIGIEYSKVLQARSRV